MLLLDWLATRRIAALMVILVQLCNRHLPQREDQAVSSIKPINNPAALPTAADLNSIQLESNAASSC